MNTREKLVKTILKAMEQEQEMNISDETNLIDDLGFDSVEIVQLMLLVEDEFGFEFDDSELGLETLSNFSALLNIVENRIGEE